MASLQGEPAPGPDQAPRRGTLIRSVCCSACFESRFPGSHVDHRPHLIPLMHPRLPPADWRLRLCCHPELSGEILRPVSSSQDPVMKSPGGVTE